MTDRQIVIVKLIAALALCALTGITIGGSNEAYVYAAF